MVGCCGTSPPPPTETKVPPLGTTHPEEAHLGGGGRNRTAVRGFAGPCLNHSATPPRRLGILLFAHRWLNAFMKIGIIAPPWTPIPPDLYGGIELVVDQLARGFQDLGHEVLLFATGDSTCPVPTQWILPTAEGHRIGSAVPEIRHVMHAYDAVAGCDIVHDHTMMGPFFSARYPDLPVVTTIHGPFNEELTDLYRVITQRVPLIAISHAQSAAAPEIPVARVIHHGVDASSFPSGDGSGDGEGDYVLFLGRMAEDKGAHRAIAAARSAGLRILMAAKMREPSEMRYFAEFVEPLLGEDVVYLGEVSHERKLELLAGARALLFPIRWNEPFGMVMIEAMACGTPVIAFKEGAAPEVVSDGQTGFLVDDVEAMATAIGRLDELSRSDCRSAVENYFSTGRMAAEHVALFESLLAKGA